MQHHKSVHAGNIYLIIFTTPDYYLHYIKTQFFSLPGVPCLAKEVEAVPNSRFSFLVSLVATTSPSLSNSTDSTTSSNFQAPSFITNWPSLGECVSPASELHTITEAFGPTLTLR